MGRAPTNDDDDDDNDEDVAVEQRIDAANLEEFVPLAAADNAVAVDAAAAVDVDAGAADTATNCDAVLLVDQPQKPQVQTADPRTDHTNAGSKTPAAPDDQMICVANVLLRSPSSRSSSSNANVSSSKRKADCAALDHYADGADAANAQMVETPAQAANVGSDIVKKARRVQSKTRGQHHPHSISSNSSNSINNISCSSCSSSCCNSNCVGSGGGGDATTMTTTTPCISSNYSNHNNQCVGNNPTSSNASGNSIGSSTAKTGRNK